MPRKAKSIADAYEILKPAEVKKAEAKGLKVVRQGEFFYVPCNTPKEAQKNLSEKEAMLAIIGGTHRFSGAEDALRDIVGKERFKKLVKDAENLFGTLPKQVEIRAGNNRPNKAEFGIQSNGSNFVRGKVEHTGREHRTVSLTSWHKVVPNTATKSFTLSGDID